MAADQIGLWLVDLGAHGEALEALNCAQAVLAADEQAWPHGERNSHRANRRATRIALRLLLARSGCDAAFGRPFVYAPGGKPGLSDRALEFSIAHSGGHALIAISRAGPVGVDLERPRALSLSPGRRRLIEAAGAALDGPRTRLPGSVSVDATVETLAAWTRLEAVAKARGSGIGSLLTDLGITAAGLRCQSPQLVAAAAAALRDHADLWVGSLELSADLVGAIAWPRRVAAGPPSWLRFDSALLAAG